MNVLRAVTPHSSQRTGTSASSKKNVGQPLIIIVHSQNTWKKYLECVRTILISIITYDSLVFSPHTHTAAAAVVIVAVPTTTWTFNISIYFYSRSHVRVNLYWIWYCCIASTFLIRRRLIPHSSIHRPYLIFTSIHCGWGPSSEVLLPVTKPRHIFVLGYRSPTIPYIVSSIPCVEFYPQYKVAQECRRLSKDQQNENKNCRWPDGIRMRRTKFDGEF